MKLGDVPNNEKENRPDKQNAVAPSREKFGGKKQRG